jgi:hypothetical protein
MVQSYSKYTYADVEALSLKVRKANLFTKIDLVEPSKLLKDVLKINLTRPLATEKAKSELIIVPILNELAVINNDIFTFFSGYNFDIDKTRGLKGHCDFLLSMEVNSPIIEAPVISIVEAKNADFELGIPQCIAQMYAAQLFNQRKQNAVNTIYGIVTIGNAWNFIKLEDSTVYIDNDIFYLNELSRLLGAFQQVIDFYSKTKK